MRAKITALNAHRIFHGVLLVFLLFCLNNSFSFAASPTNRPKDLYGIAKKKYYALIQNVSKKQHEENWLHVIDLFKNVSNHFPQSHEGYKATFTTARLYHRLYNLSRNPEHLDLALLHYKKVDPQGRKDSLADDALYGQGKILLKQKKTSEALEVFKRILDQFPDGDQVSRAKEKATRLAAVLKGEKKNNLRTANPIPPHTILRNIRVNTSTELFQILVELDGPVAFETHQLSEPYRYYVDIKNSRLKEDLPREISVGTGYLRDIRISQFSETLSRVVLEFSNDKSPQVRIQKNLSGLILQLSSQVEAQPIKKVAEKPKGGVSSGLVEKGKTQHIPLIVLDPGHGGKDDGARGVTGLLEKELNLAIAKRIKRILEKKYRYRVLMTRTEDTFVPLEKRGDIANYHEADIFVSVHVNAARRKGAKGIETYYLGSALTERARETAARENGEVIFSVPDNDVQRILMDMEANRKMNNSACLARKIQDRLFQGMEKFYSGVKNLGVKEGPFFVLHKTYMPSILVEVGFITNPQEEKRLGRSNYLDRLAGNIAKGIQNTLPVQGKCVPTI